jgi:hypothetical protein
MPKPAGVKRYNFEKLYQAVELHKPVNSDEWARTAATYQALTEEVAPRSGEDIKRQWVEKLCNGFKKVTGESSASAFVTKCQKLQLKIDKSYNHQVMGASSDSDDYDDMLFVNNCDDDDDDNDFGATSNAADGHYNAAEETSAIGGGDFLSPPLPVLISSTIEEPIAPVVSTSSTSRPSATAPKTKNCKPEGKTSNASRANISKSIASMATAVSSLATMPTTQQPPPSTAYDNMIPMMMMQMMQQMQQSNQQHQLMMARLMMQQDNKGKKRKHGHSTHND